MVKKRAGRSAFQVDFRWKGERIRRSFDDENSAVAWEADARSKLARGLPIEEIAGVDGSTLSSLLDAVVARFWKGTPNEDASTRNAEVMIEALGKNRHPKDVRAEDIDRVVRALVKAGNSTATVNRKLSALSRLFTYAVSRGIVDRKPQMDRSREKEGRLRWYTDEEEAAILQTIRAQGQDDFHDLVLFLFDTGCRLSEGCRIDWRDIDDVYARFHGTKSGRSRAVPLTSRLRTMLRRRAGDQKPAGPVFPGWEKHRAGRAWARVRAALGWEKDAEAVLHAVRHTCASRLVQAGVPIQVVQQWLGHRTLQMTLRYAHLAPVNLLQAATALEKVVPTAMDKLHRGGDTGKVDTVVSSVPNGTRIGKQEAALAA